MLNGYTLNGATLNGEGADAIVIASGSGLILAYTQTLVIDGDAGLLLAFEQEITFFASAEGLILSFEQQIVGRGDGLILEFSQLIVAPEVNSFYVRNNWYPYLYVNGSQIQTPILTGVIEVHKIENDASQMTFLTQWPKGNIGITGYEGLPVALDILYKGSLRRVFTGVIDTIDVDLVLRQITFNCLDLRRELILQQPDLSGVGYYLPEVSGKTVDKFEELSARLNTVPVAADVTNGGSLRFNNMLPQNPSFTLTSGQLYRADKEGGAQDPKVVRVNRSRIVNRVNITATYQYQRLYQQTSTYIWDWESDVCTHLREGRSYCRRDTITAAAQGAGWTVTGDISFEELPQPGFYNCGGGVAAFHTAHVAGGKLVNALDEQGNPVLDADGNPVQVPDDSGAVFSDSRNILAAGAQWNVAKRWVQNVQENYTLIVGAPQSVNRYGTREQSITVGYQDDTDNSQWEQNKQFSFMPPGSGIVGGLQWIDSAGKRVNNTIAMAIAINTAYTTIIKSHRDNHVIFTTPPRPEFDLYHTIRLNTNVVRCTGKVYKIDHYFDISEKGGEAYTRTDLALSTMSGPVVNTGFPLPPIPIFIPPTPIYINAILGSTYGQPAPVSNASGFYGNKTRTEITFVGGQKQTNVYQTNIDEQFVVTTPDIPEALRNTYTVASGFLYYMPIPDDEFSVSML